LKYIRTDSNGTHFDEYFEYIQSIRTRLPEHVYEFASNFDHYNLSSRLSLHDAWLSSIEVREPGKGERRENRNTEISLCLLGPHHDRRITLEYREVQAYTLLSQTVQAGHGDLLIHEVRISDSGFLVHEIQFVRGNVVIECKDFEHRQEIYA
jgi:hypothetical protein